MNRRDALKACFATAGSALGLTEADFANGVEIDSKEYPVIQFSTLNTISNIDELFPEDATTVKAYLPKHRAVWSYRKGAYMYGLVVLTKEKVIGMLFFTETERSSYLKLDPSKNIFCI